MSIVQGNTNVGNDGGVGTGTGLTPTQSNQLAQAHINTHTHSNKADIDAVIAADIVKIKLIEESYTTSEKTKLGTISDVDIAKVKLIEEVYTAAEKLKLGNITDSWKGVFLDSALINTTYPTPLNGWSCWNAETATVWSASSGVWSDTLASSVGDMLQATFDPQGIAADAFLRDNHTGFQAIGTITGLQDEVDKLPVIQLDIDGLVTDVNEPTTGLVDRVTLLENSGGSVTKIREHDPAGVFEMGELCTVSGSQYRANAAIDGGTAPVPFALGTTGQTWSPVSLHNPASDIIPDVADTRALGSTEKPFRAISTQFVNFFSMVNGVPEYIGNIDADSDALGVYGFEGLKLGNTNNSDDVHFTAGSIKINKKLVINDELHIAYGKNLSFIDNDSSGNEGLNFRMRSNDLCGYSVKSGVENPTEVYKLTYDGKLTVTSVSTPTLSYSCSSESGYKDQTSTSAVEVCQLHGIIIASDNTNARIQNRSGANVTVHRAALGGGSVSTVTTTLNNNGFVTLNSNPNSVTPMVYTMALGGNVSGSVIVSVARPDPTRSICCVSMVLKPS